MGYFHAQGFIRRISQSRVISEVKTILKDEITKIYVLLIRKINKINIINLSF